ncbi:MAG TPA: hypothetical protein VGB85_27530 [Nannocystis sp.]|jgi:hypothetical protein
MSSKPQPPGRPHLHVVKGGRDAAGVVEVDASFVGERTLGVVDATARPAPKALTAGAAEPVPEDMSEEAGRRLAPGAPLSPGTVPLELALHLRSGEALVWWDAKAAIDFRPILVVLGACALVLLGVTAMAPDFWAQPWSDLWPPVAALLSPALLLVLREQLSLRSLMVTDTAIIEITRRGEVSRLVFSAIRTVRRDLLTGGVLLQGKGTRIRVPPALIENARAAIVTQRKSVLRGESTQPDDPLHWMP